MSSLQFWHAIPITYILGKYFASCSHIFCWTEIWVLDLASCAFFLILSRRNSEINSRGYFYPYICLYVYSTCIAVVQGILIHCAQETCMALHTMLNLKTCLMTDTLCNCHGANTTEPRYCKSVQVMAGAVRQLTSCDVIRSQRINR